VDTLGLVLAVSLSTADCADGPGAKPLIEGVWKQLPRMKKVWVDSGYKEGFAQWLTATTGWEIEIVRRPGDGEHGVWVEANQRVAPAPRGFQVMPRRWVVERTLAWLCRYRRLSKDYEGTTASAAAWIWIAMSRLLLHRFDGET